MLIVPASNQWLLLVDGPGVTEAYTDPVPIDALDRATAILVVHKIFGAASAADRDVGYVAQVSFDGASWIDAGPTDSTGEATDPSNRPLRQSAAVHGAFLRFRLYYTISSIWSGVGGALFDLHVLLDHA